MKKLSETLTTVLTPGGPPPPPPPPPLQPPPIDPNVLPPEVPTATERTEISYRGEDPSIASLNDILVELIRFKEVPQLSEVMQQISRQIMSVISILVNDLGKLDVVRAFINKVQMTDSCKFREIVRNIVVPDQGIENIPESIVKNRIAELQPTLAAPAARAERMVQSLLSIMS